MPDTETDEGCLTGCTCANYIGILGRRVDDRDSVTVA